jgi:hypothetical protein
VLDVAHLSRTWLMDVVKGRRHRQRSLPCHVEGMGPGPQPPMVAPSTTVIRKQSRALPTDCVGQAILATSLRSASTCGSASTHRAMRHESMRWWVCPGHTALTLD